MSSASQQHVREWPLVLCFLALAGCTNPFSTREAEVPSTGGVPFIPPRTPEIVLLNLRNAIQDQNLENYLQCLSDSATYSRRFVFIAEAGVRSENPGVFEGWTIANERQYFSQLRAQLPADSLHILNLQPEQNTQFADSALFVEKYTLTVRHIQQTRGVPGFVTGTARFFMISDAFGDWAIYRWEDQSLGQEPTWSVLKATFGK